MAAAVDEVDELSAAAHSEAYGAQRYAGLFARRARQGDGGGGRRRGDFDRRCELQPRGIGVGGASSSDGPAGSS